MPVLFDSMLWVASAPLILWFAYSAVIVFKGYERGVVFTLGRFSKVQGLGLLFITPFYPENDASGSAHYCAGGAYAGCHFR